MSAGTLKAAVAVRDYADVRSAPSAGSSDGRCGPASISLLWAIGPPEVRTAVQEIHAGAVAAGMARLEREACWVARGKGGTRLERGAGFVSMGFLHRSSRAGDPAGARNKILTFWVGQSNQDSPTQFHAKRKPGQPARLCGVWGWCRRVDK